jgi:hypothetical protein
MILAGRRPLDNTQKRVRRVVRAGRLCYAIASSQY